MDGHGTYSRVSRVQATGLSPALPLLKDAARTVALPPSPTPVVSADYGASEGRNSLIRRGRDVIRAFAFLLALGLPWPATADTPKALTAILLVARAELPDPNFKDSVVLVTNKLGPAPVGVIVNRPTRIPVARLFPDLDHLARLDDKLYFGGPVEISGVSFLFRADEPHENAVLVFEGVYLSTNRELLLKLLRRDRPLEGLRIYIGYSGWAPSQLEAEISRGDWTLEPVDASAIFDGNSERPWPEGPAREAGPRT
jgi:putative transcriptional regulator